MHDAGTTAVYHTDDEPVALHSLTTCTRGGAAPSPQVFAFDLLPVGLGRGSASSAASARAADLGDCFGRVPPFFLFGVERELFAAPASAAATAVAGNGAARGV